MREWLAALAVAGLVVGASGAAADEFLVGLNGNGSLMDSPSIYTGTFMFGMVGSWSLSVDDSGWPAASDSTARFAYIWSTFFAGNYDGTPGGEAWYGYFDGSTLPSAPRFFLDCVTPEGTLGGDFTIAVMIRDADGDGVLSQREKHGDAQLAGNLTVDRNQGTGSFHLKCGCGALGTGNFNFVNRPDSDVVQMIGTLDLVDCPPQPVEDRSWGAIKALYRVSAR